MRDAPCLSSRSERGPLAGINVLTMGLWSCVGKFAKRSGGRSGRHLVAMQPVSTKQRINRAFLLGLPGPIREIVEDWQATYRKAIITMTDCTSLYIEEDAKYTAFSPNMAKQLTVRAAGEFNGMSQLRPGASCPLPPRCVMVASGFFCGVPWLTIYRGRSEDDRGGSKPACLALVIA